jgi:predicted permease
VGLLVVAAFALGIGSAAAIYTVVDSLLLRPLPYAHGERFVSLLATSLDNPGGMASLMLDDVRAYRQMRSFDVFGWMRFINYNLTSPGIPQYLNGVSVTAELAAGVGAPPRLGRWFDASSSAAEAVLSHSLWMRLGADPQIVGKPVTLSGRVYTVAGVAAPRFQLPLAGVYNDVHVDVWTRLDSEGRGEDRRGAYYFCYGRLRPGVTVQAAAEEARRVAAAIAQQAPDTHQRYTARVDPLQKLVTKEIRPVLLLLFAGAELLLLITCANVGGLLLARSVARARETALRVALGAGAGRLAQGFFWEALVVAAPGAVAGLLLATALVRAAVEWAGESTNRLEAVAMDWRVAAFAVGSSIVAAALAGLAPLWQAARTQPGEALSEGVRTSAGARSRWLSRSFVVAEIALAFVMLSASAVLLTELRTVTRVAPGFDPANLLTFRLSVAREAIPGKASLSAYQERLLAALEALPGVNGAAIVNQLPLDGCCLSTSIWPEEKTAKGSGGERVAFLTVNPGYWRTMGVPLMAGRLLSDRDRVDSQPLPVVVDQAAVRRYWPNRNPVGAFGRLGNPKGDRFQVVGVVGDVRNDGLDAATVPSIYLHAGVAAADPLIFAVRSRLPAARLVPDVRRAIQGVNAAQPIHDIRSMERVMEESLALKRVASYLMSFFALAALLMASIGAYGMVSYSVRQRTVEMGTRLALGAVSRDLLALVVGSGLKMAALGVALGGAASVGAVWLLIRELEIHSLGPSPFVFSIAVVTMVVMAASFFPAWRATLLSPLAAIRDDPGSVWETAREGLGRFFESIRGGEEEGAEEGPDATAGLIDASRGATTFRDAIGVALDTIRTRTGARSAALLEPNGAGEFRVTFAIPVSEPWSIPAGGVLLGRLRSYNAPLPVSAGDIDVWRRWAAEYRPGAAAEIATLDRAGVRLATPLRGSRDISGLLVLGAPEGRDAYRASDKRLLRGAAEQFALLIENARLTDRVLEQEKLRRDVALAADVQRGLLPPHGLETASASLSGLNLSARTIGGDYFDFFELGEGRVAIALADVAGKGVPAALIMSVVQASLRVIASEPAVPLPELAARMNHFVYRSTGPSSYATFFYAEFDGRRLRYVNAAQSPVYVVRAVTGAVEEIETGGTVIGMFARQSWEDGAVELASGDVLLVATDGVTDALNPAELEYGEERLKALLPRIAPLPLEAMAEALLGALKAWIEDAPQYDDLTFVLLKVK